MFFNNPFQFALCNTTLDKFVAEALEVDDRGVMLGMKFGFGTKEVKFRDWVWFE
jgi:hypothetical protein